jgi:pentatricopeptide repeat domain-containing protein 3
MEPPIDAFIPTKIFTEESVVEVKDLKNLIEDADVTDAILVYRLLQKNNIEIPAELKQSFFELICFYNCDEPLDEDLIEERWFRQIERNKERHRKTWKDHDLAEQIFGEIEPKDSRTFSTIIRGMCKFYQVEKAWALFNDAQNRNIVLDVEAYNSILQVVTFLKESAELRYDLIVELLTAMKTAQVDPNLGTLNACLSTISMMGGRNPKDYALAILSEFKNIGVEPSLASWFYVLQTFCKDRGPVSHVIIDILNQIEGKEFKIRDIKDTHFFVTAMDVCRNHLHDRTLAKRVNDLLHVGNNYNLIGDSFKESIYYRNFFALLVATEPLDSFMEFYHTLVPNVYIPEPAVMEEILKVIEVSGAIEHVPIIWSHMLLFDHINRENLLDMLTRIMIQNKPNPSFPQQENLEEKFASIGYDMFTKIEEKNEMRSKPIVWTGKLLSDIITLLCRVEDLEKASEVYEKLSTNQDKVLGEPNVSAMQDFVQLCIVKKQPSRAINCLQYCNDMCFAESRDIGKSICIGFTLDENHLKRVAYLVGNDVLKEAEEEKLKQVPTPSS